MNVKPTAPAPAPPSDAAIRAGSKSFALASRVFDETTRQQVWDLYAWCRHCDDAVDGQTLGYPGAPAAEPAARLAEVAAQTDLALGDEAIPQPAVFAGLRRLRLSTSLPSSLPREHLRGFAMDVGGRTYDSLDDTLEYRYHVAGVVGLMMAWIMGVRDAATLQRACDSRLGLPVDQYRA